jgi:hypothetical protein
MRCPGSARIINIKVKRDLLPTAEDSGLCPPTPTRRKLIRTDPYRKLPPVPDFGPLGHPNSSHRLAIIIGSILLSRLRFIHILSSPAPLAPVPLVRFAACTFLFPVCVALTTFVDILSHLLSLPLCIAVQSSPLTPSGASSLTFQ